MLRGNHHARIDDKGRLKLPAAFKTLVEDQHGTGLYVTSLRGDSVLIYPMPIWEAIERRIAASPSSHPSLAKYVERVSFFGQQGEFDSQGRISISPHLREAANMSGEVAVLGKVNYLEVWNRDRFASRLQREPFTEEDAAAVAQLGI